MQPMNAARKERPAAVSAANKMLAVLRVAEIGNHPAYGQLAPPLLSDLIKNGRIARRLYADLVEEFGEPVLDGSAMERFFLSPFPALKDSAISAGLAFRLPAFGDVLDRNRLRSLVDRFGNGVAMRALKYTALVPSQRVAFGSIEDCFPFVEADGWTLIQQWVLLQKLDPRWRIRPQVISSAQLRHDVMADAAPLVRQALTDTAIQEDPK